MPSGIENYNSVEVSINSETSFVHSSQRKVQTADNTVGRKKINLDLPENQEIKEEEDEEEE